MAEKKIPERNANGTFKKKGAKKSGGGLAARLDKVEKSLGKVEHHQGQQDKAIRVCAEELDTHSRRLDGHDRALDDLLTRAGEHGAPGFRRFKVA